MLFRIIALKIFAKLPRKNPWWNLLFISLLVGNCDIFRTTTFPKSFGRLLLNFYQDSRNYQPKAAVPRCSVKKVFLEISQNFAKFLRTPFILEHLWWLLLINLPFTRISLFLSLQCLIMFYKENHK